MLQFQTTSGDIKITIRGAFDEQSFSSARQVCEFYLSCQRSCIHARARLLAP